MIICKFFFAKQNDVLYINEISIFCFLKESELCWDIFNINFNGKNAGHAARLLFIFFISMVDVLLSDAEKVFIIHGVQVHNSEKRYLTFHALSIIHLPVFEE
jgi:hypothetical protein